MQGWNDISDNFPSDLQCHSTWFTIDTDTSTVEFFIEYYRNWSGGLELETVIAAFVYIINSIQNIQIDISRWNYLLNVQY